MEPKHDGIRKAAILVASLDRATVDAMLETLDPKQARQIRQAAMELDEIDAKEQRKVIDEFLRVGPMVPGKHPPGVELGGRLARRLSMRQQGFSPGESSSAYPADARPFHFLHEAEGDRLARVLAGERPQTIALVLSHLPPERAGGVLARLPGALQADVIHRLIDLEETDPEILREVEQVLESRLSQQVHMQRRRVAGLKAVTGILEASEGAVGVQILDNLATHDQSLAERLAPRRVRFADLAQWDDDALAVLLRAAPPELMVTALVGATPELIDRILSRLPAPEAETFRRTLNHPGPIRLQDMETARQQIAEMAWHLAVEGRLRIPRQQPTTVS